MKLKPGPMEKILAWLEDQPEKGNKIVQCVFGFNNNIALFWEVYVYLAAVEQGCGNVIFWDLWVQPSANRKVLYQKC